MFNKVWFRTGIFLLCCSYSSNYLWKYMKYLLNSYYHWFSLSSILISGFLFYICLPFQNILEKWGFPRWASITTIFIGLIVIIAIVVSFIAPIIISNINNLIKQTPSLQKKPNN